jgi:hypothetical protein
MKTLSLRFLALLLGFGLVVAACGGGDDSSEEAAEDTTTTTEAAEDEDEDEDTTTTTEAEDDDSDEGDERDDAIGDFGDEIEEELDVPVEETGYSSYVEVTDDSGQLRVSVPVEWTDVDGRQGIFGPNIIASTSVEDWLASYDVPGIWFEATSIQTGQTNDEILTAVSTQLGQVDHCTSLGRTPYEDPAYVGVYETFDNCAGTETDFVWLAFSPPDNAFHGVVGVQIFSDADVAALEEALATFLVTPAG